jgi:hypothetical protein
MATTISEGVSPGPGWSGSKCRKIAKSVWAAIAESISRSPSSDEPELDGSMAGADLSPDGVSVSIGFAAQVLVSADHARKESWPPSRSDKL